MGSMLVASPTRRGPGKGKNHPLRSKWPSEHLTLKAAGQLLICLGDQYPNGAGCLFSSLILVDLRHRASGWLQGRGPGASGDLPRRGASACLPACWVPMLPLARGLSRDFRTSKAKRFTAHPEGSARRAPGWRRRRNLHLAETTHAGSRGAQRTQGANASKQQSNRIVRGGRRQELA